MRNQNNTENQLETAAVSAVAAASKTPFTTAFKITLGIAAAHLVVAATVFCGFGAVATAIYLLAR